MRWLITGGAGFIGSSFIRLALAERSELHILNFDALTYAGRRENLADLERETRLAFLQGDVADPAAVEAAIRACPALPDAIVHFAAESHVDRSLSDPALFVRTNVLGTQVLLDAARRHAIPRFLHVSTDEVYGSLGATGQFTEDSPLAPNSPYAASKAGAECLVRAAVHSCALPAVVVRASNNYGPRQFPEKLIPLAILRARAGRFVPMYGAGDQVRNWIHVDDACRGILAALERGAPGRVYNLGGDEELANRVLLERLLGLMDRPTDLIRRVPDRAGHDFRYSLDSSRAQRELDWRPRIALADGLRQTVAWFAANGDWLAAVQNPDFDAYLQRQYGEA